MIVLMDLQPVASGHGFLNPLEHQGRTLTFERGGGGSCFKCQFLKGFFCPDVCPNTLHRKFALKKWGVVRSISLTRTSPIDTMVKRSAVSLTDSLHSEADSLHSEKDVQLFY